MLFKILVNYLFPVLFLSSSTSLASSLLTSTLKTNTVTRPPVTKLLISSYKTFTNNKNTSFKRTPSNNLCERSPFWYRIISKFNGSKLNFVKFLEGHFCNFNVITKSCQRHAITGLSTNRENHMKTLLRNQPDIYLKAENCKFFNLLKGHHEVIKFSRSAQPPFCPFTWYVDVGTTSWWKFISKI